jgi:hypothetical protein
MPEQPESSNDREDGTSRKPEKPELAALIATQKFFWGTLHIASICEEGEYHRLNMELQRFPTFILGSCVQLYSLAETPQLPNSPPRIGFIYEGAISQPR